MRQYVTIIFVSTLLLLFHDWLSKEDVTRSMTCAAIRWTCFIRPTKMISVYLRTNLPDHIHGMK